EQGSKTGAGIEPRKTKPIHATVATHQRACLRVTEKPVVLNFCIFLGHLTLPLIRIPTRLGAASCAVHSAQRLSRRKSAEDRGHYSSCYYSSASLSIPSRVNRNTVHSSIGFAPS